MKTITATVSVAHVTDNSRTEEVRMYSSAGAQAVNSFAAGAPKLTVDLTVDSSEAKGFFKPGKLYRVEFTPVD
jgi:hypothetical protein